METLERSRVCRLCGKHAGITINIFGKRGNYVKKINSILPILVHEMDLLPKHICHLCNYKLQEFHKFYEDCLKTDANLKGQLSWMRGSVEREEKGVPMVQINNFMIKTEPPDYDDHDTTEVSWHGENFTNYVKNNCIAYSERMFPNRNHIDDEIAKTGAKTRAIRHSNEKNNNEQFTSRDTIRRNLFATEIFDNKNPRIQTEIPICNISQKVMSVKTAANALHPSVRLERIDYPQDGYRVAKKLKMTDDINKMSTRTLRPRKTRATHLSHVVSAPDVTTKSSSKDNYGIDLNGFKTVEVKMEASEEFERSLRPRVGAIDYSETKQKNPMSRTIKRKREKSFDNQLKLNNNVERKIDENLLKYMKSPNFLDPQVRIKVEPKEFTENSRFSNAEKKTSNVIFEEFLKNSVIEKISSGRSFNRPKSRDLDHSRAKVSNASRRRNLPKNCGSPYLRSQRGHLRNGKLKTFDSIVEKPKKIKSSKDSCGILLEPIKREKCEINERPVQIFKYRDCDMCNRRFASAELYMLHDCYANKRH